MSAHQLLKAAGLFEQYKQAVNDNDPDQMIKLLRQAGMSADDAKWVATVVLENPVRYGF